MKERGGPYATSGSRSPLSRSKLLGASGATDGAEQSNGEADDRDELRLAGGGSPLSRLTHLGASRRRGHRLIYVLPY